jgi:hypothetical protein
MSIDRAWPVGLETVHARLEAHGMPHVCSSGPDDYEVVDEHGKVLTTLSSTDSCNARETGDLCGGCSSCLWQQAEHAGLTVRRRRQRALNGLTSWHWRLHRGQLLDGWYCRLCARKRGGGRPALFEWPPPVCDGCWAFDRGPHRRWQ